MVRTVAQGDGNAHIWVTPIQFMLYYFSQAEKIPFMKKKVVPQKQEVDTKRKQYVSRRPYLHDEVSKISSENTSMRSYMFQPSYYGSTVTIISFESNV